jgi:hypothetical protein
MAVVEKDVASARMPHKFAEKGEPLSGAFFWLSAFYVFYCARPEDWIPGLKYIPLAQISGLFALLGLLTSAGKTKRGLSDLPREAKYFFAIVGLLFLAAVLSPVWRGGAVDRQESGVPPPDFPNRSQRRLRSQGGSRVLEPVVNGESSGALTTPLRNQR